MIRYMYIPAGSILTVNELMHERDGQLAVQFDKSQRGGLVSFQRFLSCTTGFLRILSYLTYLME